MRYIFLFLWIGWSFSALAQDSFTLSECIDYTLDNHPSVSVYENNREIARAESNQSVASYLPQVMGSAGIIDNLELQTTILPAGLKGPESAEVQFGTQFNTTVGIDVNQTIYDQSKIMGIKAGEPYEEMTRLQQEQNKETLIYNTATAYFQVLIYNEQLSILESNKHKYEELVATLSFQEQKGVVLENDVDRVRVNLSATNYQIKDARTQIQLALNALKNAMGMPYSVPLEVVKAIDYASFANMQMEEELILDNLTEIKINQKQIALQEIDVKMTRASYIPTLNFVGKYATQTLSNEFEDAFSGWNEYSYVGLSLQVPIFSGLGRINKLHEANLKLENEQSNYLINSQNLQLRFENAKTSVGTAYSSFQSNLDNLNLAKKLLDVTEYQYQQGVVSLTDYLNDDTAYKNAQSNYIKSLYGLIINQLDYQKSQGTLLEFISTIK